MDPNACLKFIFGYLEDADYEQAFYSCLDLLGWLDKGGFLPTPYMTLATTGGETAYNVDDLRGFLRVTMDNCKRLSA